MHLLLGNSSFCKVVIDIYMFHEIECLKLIIYCKVVLDDAFSNSSVLQRIVKNSLKRKSEKMTILGAV